MPHQMVGEKSTKNLPTHYEVLDLSQSYRSDADLSAQHLKAAYRRALIRHHPDKSRAPSDPENLRGEPASAKSRISYTIDQISEAYATLTVPKLRAEYDRVLKARGDSAGGVLPGKQNMFRTGFEIVDLDDLGFDQVEGIWYRSCRCGDERGFLIREADLEESSDIGELYVGCRGCSLWMKVLFGVIEESSEGQVVEHG